MGQGPKKLSVMTIDMLCLHCLNSKSGLLSINRHEQMSDGYMDTLSGKAILQFFVTFLNRGLGPVVQSIVSLTNSLRGQLVKRFTT